LSTVHYEITEVPTFELRRIITDGETTLTGFVGMYKTRELAEKHRDKYKLQDEVFADNGYAEQEL
jgi:hypothetical protein